jgi:hypothetical protein
MSTGFICIYYLCKYNAKNAKIRGRDSWNVYAYTIALSLGFEFLGLLAAAYFQVQAMKVGDALPFALFYVVVLVFVVIGSGISIWLSKRGDLDGLKQNQLTAHEISLVALSTPLDTPCQITITRERSSYAEFNHPIYVQVNGQFVGIVNSEQTVHFTTSRQQNIVTGGNAQNLRLPTACSFTASPGGQVFISIRGSNIAPVPTTVPTV